MSSIKDIAERTALMSKPRGDEPVTLTPAWESINVPEEELNFTELTMQDAHLQLNPPKDRLNIVYWIFVVHGIGVLIPWNMFITAKSYFMDYKLSKTYTGIDVVYLMNFMFYLQIASQLPNFLFNWFNVFVRSGGNLAVRIVWSITALIILFILTSIMAMIDTSTWPNTFFWFTMVSVVAINIASGIYQNTIYGLAARLPSKYSGGIVLGFNISGTFTSIVNILADEFTTNKRTAAIYYFITALFVLLICFDTYFCLPLNKFYRFYDQKHNKEVKKSQVNNNQNVPYWKIFKKAFPQLLNVYVIFVVTLSLFPSVHSEIKQVDPNFIFGGNQFMNVLCFLSFNVCTVIGSYLATKFQWPGPKNLKYAVWLRLLLVPLFLLCDYQPTGVVRTLPVLIKSDWIYWAVAAAMAISSGYLSSLAIQYCPGQVKPEHSAIAGMLAGACLITGILSGIVSSYFWPIFVQLF
uniref:Equilibrative nucleoside transporter 1 n=1 Tax=Cuerna arida TaxID=1464854 RepID=A0A1B6FGI1_9HEMI